MKNWKDNYDYVWGFDEGLAPVAKNGYEGYVNKKGEVVIPLTYDSVGDFNKGLASVYKDAEWFKINKKGERV